MTTSRSWAAIEFIGLPGVGKSTLSHRVAEILQRRGWRVAQPTYSADHDLRSWERQLLKVRLVLAEAVLHPIRTASSVRAILATRQAGASDLIHVTVNWLFMSSLLRKAERREGVHIFDEGLLNALWSIGFRARSAAHVTMLERLARQRSTPVVVALMESDIPSIRERLHLRKNGDSRLERTEHMNDGWERGLRTLQQVKATLQLLINEGNDIRVVPVRNQRNEDLDALATGLAATLERILVSSGATPQTGERAGGNS